MHKGLIIPNPASSMANNTTPSPKRLCDLFVSSCSRSKNGQRSIQDGSFANPKLVGRAYWIRCPPVSRIPPFLLGALKMPCNHLHLTLADLLIYKVRSTLYTYHTELKQWCSFLSVKGARLFPTYVECIQSLYRRIRSLRCSWAGNARYPAAFLPHILRFEFSIIRWEVQTSLSPGPIEWKNHRCNLIRAGPHYDEAFQNVNFPSTTDDIY